MRQSSVSVALTLTLLSPAQPRCGWSGGPDPTFSGPPQIEQINVHVVKVTWHNVLQHRECADWMEVEWWRSGGGQTVMRSGKKAKTTHLVTGLSEGVNYTLRVIAIEDKNAWRSIEFNRSPNITFRTSDPEREKLARIETSDSDSYQDTGDPAEEGKGKGFLEEHFYLVVIGGCLAGIVALIVIASLLVTIWINLLGGQQPDHLVTTEMLLPSPGMVKESRCQVCDGGSCSDSGTSPGPEDERSLKLLMCGPTVALQ